MQLDSVRNLKQSLNQQLIPQLLMGLSARSAAPVERLTEMRASLALGVAPSGRQQYRLAVRVQRRDAQNSPLLEQIQQQARDEVDIRYVGRIAKRAKPWYRQRQRPLRIGCSVAHYQVTAGTLGAFVRPRTGEGLLMLSNNHVLANENRGQPGDAILQPGAYDGGSLPGDAVATLGRSVKLLSAVANQVDCALGALNADIDCERLGIEGLGTLAGLGDAVLDAGSGVRKLGRTTGLTQGRVSAFEVDNIVVNYDIGALRFDNQIEIESAGPGSFSDGGDSGSLIVDDQQRAVALLFAGSDQGGANGLGLTYANPIRAVLDALQVDLAL